MEKNTKNSSKITQINNNIRTKASGVRSKFTSIVDTWPLGSFFGFLVLIVVLIVIGNTLRKPQQSAEETQKPAKEVEVFSIGKAPKMMFSGSVEKSGALKVVAQSPGVVQVINVLDGGKVNRGQMLFGLSTNYQGGNIASIGRQLAEKNAQFSTDNYAEQIALIARQKEAAQQADTNADELRSITSSSIQATRDLIAINQEIVNSMDNQLAFLESTNVGGANDAAILQSKQGKAGLMSGLLSLKTALANTEYQVEAGAPPEKLSDLGKDIALGQLQIQEKSLQLGKEVAELNLKIAQISESLMYPSSPCAGVMERVYVSIGDTVNPGQQLGSIACTNTVATVVVLVSGDIAKQISRIENSTLLIGNTPMELAPRYISTEPTEGNLHTVLFTLPEHVGADLSDNSAIPVEMPIGSAQSTVSVPYVPIDAVFQTQTTAIIYVASQSAEGTWFANGKDIQLGQVFGSFVEVLSGLSTADQVIINRDVIAGDEVKFHE